MRGISYGDDKEGEKKQKGKNSGVLSQGLSRQEAAGTPRAGGPLGEGASGRPLQSRAQGLGCQSGDHRHAS